MAIVIVCNLVKSCCMARIAWKQDPAPLITLGDLIASFLNRHDPTTRGNCLAEEVQFSMNDSTNRWIAGSDCPRKAACSLNRIDDWNGTTWSERPSNWKTTKARWFVLASRQRWIVSISICTAILSAASVILDVGLTNPDLPETSFSSLWSMGFGTVSPYSTLQMSMSGSSGLFLTILTSDSPQLLLSFLYLNYNGLFTAMLLGREWNAYATHRKPLRVTSPRGQQRSTYWLQLPYRYSIPLLLASAALHWLVSQSLFLAYVTSLDHNEKPSKIIATCGYSNIAIIFMIILGSLLVLLALGQGFWRLNPIMSLARSCSAAISAACHPPEGDTDAALRPVKWGVVGNSDISHEEKGLKHCTFTSLEVKEPVEGQLYS
ncbi:hypothetical protein ACLMJK_009508 [Lecanora helva]